VSDEHNITSISPLLGKVRISASTVTKISIALVLIGCISLMFPRGESIELDYKVGAVWAQKDLIAPFSFPIYRDEREYAHDVEEARGKVYPVFERDAHVVDRQLGKLEKFIEEVQVPSSLWIQYRTSVRQHRPSVAGDSAAFYLMAADVEIPLSEQEWNILADLAKGNRLQEMLGFISAPVREYYRVGILDRLKNTLGHAEVALRDGTAETIVPSARLYDHNDIAKMLEKDLLTAYKADKSAADIAHKIGIMFTVPNEMFSQAAMNVAIAAAIEAVPRTVGFVQENERVVSKHERITAETKLKLESLRRARAEREPASETRTQLAGVVLHSSMVILLFGIYLYLFRKRIFGNNRRLALVALIMLMECFFAYLTRELDVVAPIEYLILVPAASMLLTIIFDSRVGFYGTVTIAFLVAGIRGNDYSIALASLVAGALSVYTVRDMKNRTQIFRSLGFIFLGYALAITALALERFETMNVVAGQFTFALANAIISPVLTYGLLIFFERVFKVTTDLTLMEVSHFNHPLLRMLAEQAPGTYHHSMTMGSLAEAAAAEVGANAVLARAGAYFHDIGKIVKPTYFVENQKTSRSRHDKLAPRMSSLIISAHVKEGIALAREHNLPEELVDFIPMHHGTTRIEYFYNKALKLAESSNDETKIDEIKDQDYRYPGPKPQTKETGILMLADAIEATARTLEDPSPQKLEVAIDELIRKRFEEGELDECPLTLKDLTKIKEAFLGVLIGIYHTRVKYPEAEVTKSGKQSRRVRPAPETADEHSSETLKQINNE
jgi:hypothetical protein